MVDNALHIGTCRTAAPAPARIRPRTSRWLRVRGRPRPMPIFIIFVLNMLFWATVATILFTSLR